MTLKSYDFLNPQTGETKVVFEFPISMMTGYIKPKDAVITTENPLTYPLMSINKAYLTEHENCRTKVGDLWIETTFERPPKTPEEEAEELIRKKKK